MKLYTKPRVFSRPFSVAHARGSLSTLPAADFLDRVSVFETFRVYDGRIFHCQEHLLRLSESCAALGYPLPLEKKVLRSWLEASLRQSGFKDAMVRLSAHWPRPRFLDPCTSVGAMDSPDISRYGDGRWVLFVRKFKSHPQAWYEKGVALRTAVGLRPSFKAQNSQIKASQYVCGVLAALDLGEIEAHELLFLGSLGTLAEGVVSNIFIIQKKSLLTPSVGSGILKGVTRAFVINLARRRGLEVVECPLTRHEVYTAQECFITNTSSEVLPVVCVDGRVIGSGCPGPLTKKLAEDFKKSR